VALPPLVSAYAGERGRPLLRRTSCTLAPWHPVARSLRSAIPHPPDLSFLCTPICPDYDLLNFLIGKSLPPALSDGFADPTALNRL
jgi:hypothetical protein